MPRQAFYSIKRSWILRAEWAMGCNTKGSARHRHLVSAPCHSLLAKALRELGNLPTGKQFFLIIIIILLLLVIF